MDDRKEPPEHRQMRLRALDDEEAVECQQERIDPTPNDPFHPYSRSKGEKARNRQRRR